MSPRVTDVQAHIMAVLDARGVDLEDLTVSSVGRRDIVRIVVDRDGGVDLDTIADLSGEISLALDQASSLFAGAYVLEVTSPGVDRPLTQPRHWRRARGRLVALRTTSGDSLVGRVRSSSDEAATLELDTDREVVVDYADIEHAVVQVEFNRPEGES